ncbi:hypothetical protein R3X27_15570 [Tropicimonas sp. TH_r6]|uniref:hypothetical protein n=1 Tax=Tropicimonas sp. TH_r6 TaxID=3082085 RepID=UPI002952F652|nr:hypothetical protein [Tropicimonas sp. TH_r6]MDV7144106.1 hypothetical protein [Tropicimonas sp. TH_r6]
MQIPRSITVAVATFLLTFSAGYLALNADALAARFAGAESGTPMRLDTSVSVTRVARAAPSGEEIYLPEDPLVEQLPRPAPQLYELRLPEDGSELR